MDEELKAYLDGKFDANDRKFEAINLRLDGMDLRFDAIDRRFEAIDRRFEAIDRRFEELRAEISLEISESLKEAFGEWSKIMLHEIGIRFTELNQRYESTEARLKLHAGLLQSGARAMARFIRFSENAERRWIDLLSRTVELERRAEKRGDT